MLLGTQKYFSGWAFTVLSLFTLSAVAQTTEDITVTVVSSPAQFTPGNSSGANEYRVTVGKTGTNIVSNIKVKIGFDNATGVDSIDWACTGAGSSTCSQVSGSSSDNEITVNFNLVNQDTVSIDFDQVDYAPEFFSDLVFTAVLTDDGDDNSSTNSTDSNTVLRESVSLINIANSDSKTDYTPGETSTYNVLISNSGPSAVQDLTFNDIVPVGFSVTSWSCTPTSNCSNTAGNNVNPSLQLGVAEQAHITVHAAYAPSATANPMDYQVQVTLDDAQSTAQTGSVLSDTDSNTRAPISNLSVTVNTNPVSLTYTPGDNQNFTVVVTNNGPSDVTGVSVIDNMPTAMESVTWTCSASSGSLCNGGNGHLNTTIDLKKDGTATFTVAVDYYSGASANPLLYEVTATNPSGYTPTAAVIGSTSLARKAYSVFMVSLDDNNMEYTPGTPQTYMYSLRNDGPSDALGVTINDNNLAEFATIIWDCAIQNSGNSVCTDLTGTAAINTSVDIVAGETITYDIDVDYLSNAVTNPLIYSITADNPNNTDTPSSTATDSDVLARKVKLSISKEGKIGTLVPNEPFSYIITVTNDGPSDLGAALGLNNQPAEQGVLLSDLIDPTLINHPTMCAGGITTPCWEWCASDLGVQDSAISPSNCSSGVDVSTDAGYQLSIPIRLAKGSSSQVLIHARVSNSSGIECDNQIAGDNEVCNSADITLVETATTTNIGTAPLVDSHSNEIVYGTDLKVTKTDNQQSATPGSEVTYEIEVTNDGFLDVNGITVEDIMPLYTTQTPAGFVAGSVTWSCQANQAGACCTSGTTACGFPNPITLQPLDYLNASIDLDAQTSVTYTVKATLASEASGILTNTATATLPNGISETDTNNNSDTDTTNLEGASDIVLTKEVIAASISEQYTDVVDLVYEIKVTNLGPSRDTHINVVDDFNISSQFDISTAEWFCLVNGVGSCAETQTVSGQGINSYVDLAVNAEAVFTVKISTNSGAKGQVYNLATATSSGVDSVSLNNQDDAVYSLSGAADILIDFDDSRTTAVPGAVINYTMQVSNEGPDDLFGGIVESVFPAELQNVNWTCSAVSPIPGDLTWQYKSDFNLPGSDMAVSSDGSHIYVVSPDTDGTGVLNGSIHVFKRFTQLDNQLGQIQHIQGIEQGQAGVNGLEQPIQVAMGAFDQFVYVLATTNSNSTAGIAVFARVSDPLASNFGELTYQGFTTADMPTNPVKMQLSHDNKHLYISGDDAIHIFTIDQNNNLSLQGTQNHTDAGQMIISADGSVLYVAEGSGADVTGYAREDDQQSAQFGELLIINTVSEPAISDVTDMTLSHDGKQLYLVASSSNQLVVLNRNLDTNGITFAISYDNAVLGLQGLETLVGIESVTASKDGQHLVISNHSDSSLYVMARNSQGLLSFRQRVNNITINGVVNVAFTPDGKHIITTSDGPNATTVSVFKRRQPDPLFAFMESETQGIFDTGDNGSTVDGLLGASTLALSSDGKNLYAAGLGSDALVQFKRDKSKGVVAATAAEHLTYQKSYFNNTAGIQGLADVNSIAITPNDQFVYVASSDQSTLTVFSRDQDGDGVNDGDLQFVDSYSHQANPTWGLLGVADILIDAAGQNLYVAARFQASVSHYKIATDGTLSLIDTLANGDPGVSGLAGARALAMSPGQNHIYVAAGIDDALVVLKRNVGDGSIQFMSRNLTAGDQPMDVKVSKDGGHVYIVSSNDSKISVMRRIANPSDDLFGQVTLIKTYTDGVAGFNQLSGVRRVVLSPDDRRLYVAAEFDNAITVIDRDDNPNSATFGHLTAVEFQKNGVNDVTGLGQPYDLIASSDGRHVYSAGFADHAISSFILGSGSSCAAQGSGNILDSVDIGGNGNLTYQINATIDPSATGQLLTAGRIIPPDNFTFINGVDACNTVDNTDVCDNDSTDLIPEYDLAITKNDGQLSSIPGQNSHYKIVVTNQGPSDAISDVSNTIQVLDVLSNSFTSGSGQWTCEAIGSGSLGQLQVVNNKVDNNPTNDRGLRGVAATHYAEDLAGLGPYLVSVSVLDDRLSAYAITPANGQLGAAVTVSATAANRLDGARDVLVIDDYIYVVSQVADAVTVFKAIDNNGLVLQLFETHHFSTGVNGLNQAVAVRASADGKNLYVAAANDQSVVVFSRNLITGGLSYIETLRQGVGGNDGLAGINTLAVSADGYSVYTSGLNQSAIGIYERNLITGELSLNNVINEQTSGVSLVGVSAITVSSDNRYVYAVLKNSHKIIIFSRDVSDINNPDYGNLSWVDTVTQGENGVVGLLGPAALTISPDGRHAYVAAEQSNSLLWFGRDDATGALSFGGIISDGAGQTDGLNGVLDVSVSNDGKYVYAAASQDHALSVYARRADSACPASGVGSIATAGGTFGVPVSIAAQGQLTFNLIAEVASNATNTVKNKAAVYSCPTGHTGLITDCVGAETDLSDNWAEDVNTVNTSADLSITKTDGLAQFDGLLGAVRVTGSNKHVYTAARGDNAIGVFSRKLDVLAADFGDLSFEQSVANGQAGVSGLLAVSDVLLSGDGQTLYAAGTGDNSVVALRRNLTTGLLTFLEKQSSGVFGVEGLEGVSDLALSPDGKHLYATGPLTGTLSVFSITGETGPNLGRLTYIQKLQNAVAGVNGLAAVSDVLVSADGKHVYALSNSDNSVSVFLRNPNSNSQGYGQLNYLTTYRQGDPGIGGLIGPVEMIMSDNNGGDYLYILGAADASLVVFARDAATGELSFVEFKQNGSSQVEGLSGANHLTFDVSQDSLFVAGRLENSLVRFNRDGVTGSLQFAQVLKQGDALGQPGQFIDGLDGVAGLMVTPDGQQLFSVSADSHAVTGFEIDLTGDLSYQYSLVDGEGGIAPGSVVTYTIIARNEGPSDAKKVVVKDTFPADFSQVSYECFPVNNASCRSGIFQGNVDEVVDLPAGSQVEIIATGTLRSDVTGTLSNTATVMSSSLPGFVVSDPNINNNTATDNNTLLSPAVDLKVSKDNGLGVDTVVPGTQISYNILVENKATANTGLLPSDARNVLITDNVPESISQVSWTCDASPEVGLLRPGTGLSQFIEYSDLDSYKDLVVTANGLYAYAVGTLNNESVVSVYQRDDRDGSLQPLQLIRSTDAGINGLDGAVSIIVSHDQLSVYVAALDADALVHFRRQPDGQLAFSEVLIDGVAGINGLGGANQLLISADDRFIYVAAGFDDAIGIFKRNLADGSLTQHGLLTGIEGLVGVNGLSLHDNGQYLFVIAALNQSLAVFARDHGTGLLTAVDVVQNFELGQGGLADPLSVVYNKLQVLVTSGSEDRVTVFDFDAMAQTLTYANTLNFAAGAAPSSIQLAQGGEQLYAAASGLGQVSLHQWLLNQYQASSANYGSSDSPGLANTETIKLAPNDDYLYALGQQLVVMQVADGSSCTATGIGQLSDVANIIAGGSVSYTLTGTVLDTATGRLINSVTAVPAGDTLELNAADNIATDDDLLEPQSDLRLTKEDGLSEVVAGTGISYTLGAFSTGPSAVSPLLIDAVPIFPGSTAGMESGSLAWGCATPDPIELNVEYTATDFSVLSAASAMVMNAVGNRVYVAGGDPQRIAVFAKDPAGQLQLLNEITEGEVFEELTLTGLSEVSDLVLSNNEDYLYVSAAASDSLFVLSLLDGDEFELIQTVTSSSANVIGLSSPHRLVLSPDNSGLYVAANGSHAITVFSRNQTTGMLTFVERVKDGFGTIVPESNVIIGIQDLAITPDGRYLYTAADFSNSIAIFSRNLNNQVLSFETVIRTGDSSGQETVPDMNGMRQLLLSPNADYLYALAPDAQRLLVFSQDSDTGELLYSNGLHVSDQNSGSLQFPVGMSLTPDSGYLILADETGAAINQYKRNAANGSLGLIDVYTNLIDPGVAMTAPTQVINDGINVLALSPTNNALTALRLVAEAECLTHAGTDDLVQIDLYMKPGSSAQTVIQARVHPSARGEIINEAELVMPVGSIELDPASNIAEDRTQIIIETDVAVLKTGPVEIIAGEIIDYEIILSNSGPSDALGVQLKDVLSNQLSQVNWTCTATGRSVCTNASGNGDIDEAVNVTIDGEVSFHVTARVNPYFTGQLENTAEAIVFEEGFNTDTELNNNSATITTAVTQQLDISVQKSLLTQPVVAGTDVMFEIVVTNSGPSGTSNAVIKDSLASYLRQAAWSCQSQNGAVCQLNGQGSINDIVDLPPLGQLTYSVTAQLNQAAQGLLENTALVTIAAPVIDLDDSNNSSYVSDDITQVADMEVLLSDNIDPYDPDSNYRLIYQIQVINHGPSMARNISNISVIPDLQNDILIVSPESSCELNINELSCTTAELAAGGLIVTDASMVVLENAPGQVQMSSDVVSIYPDPNQFNNEAIETTDLLAGIDVRIHKTDHLEMVEPGVWVEYTITVDNVGSVDAGDVIVDEQMPAGLINGSWQCQASNGASCLNVDEFNITGGGNIPAAGVLVFTLKAQVDPALAYSTETEITNSVSVQLVQGTETSLLNNSDSDTDALVLYIFKNGFESITP